MPHQSSYRPWQHTRWFVVDSGGKVVARFNSCLLAEAKRCVDRMFPGESYTILGNRLLSKAQREQSRRIRVWYVKEFCEAGGIPIEEIIRPDEREQISSKAKKSQPTRIRPAGGAQ